MKHLLISIAVVIAVDLFATKAPACTCVLPEPTDTLKEQVNYARTYSHSVFSGHVLRIERAFPVVLVTLQVDGVWKGASSRTFMVTTDAGNCGYGFRLGEQYLVYAYEQPKATGFFTDVCTRTAVFSKASADLKVLGKPRRPLK